MSRKVYVGHIKNRIWDSKFLVPAADEAEARAKVIEKAADELGKSFQEDDVSICVFGDTLNIQQS